MNRNRVLLLVLAVAVVAAWNGVGDITRRNRGRIDGPVEIRVSARVNVGNMPMPEHLRRAQRTGPTQLPPLETFVER